MFQKSVSRSRWRAWVQPWLEFDGPLLILPVALTIFGGIMIRSTELHLGWTDWWQHWLVGGIGLLLAVSLARWPYDSLIQLKWVIYGVTNISLLAVMFIGTTALGAQRWITIGGFNIQPSEFAKIGMIITLAALLHERPPDTLGSMFKTLAITAVPWGLVFIQPDLGTSLVFGVITLGMLYWGNTNPGWIILMISPLVATFLFSLYLPGWFAWTGLMALIGWRTLPWPFLGALGTVVMNLIVGRIGSLLWNILKDYQKERLTTFLTPEKDPLGAGYHLIQSRIAIGSGGLHGRGLYNGTQTQLNFIPEQHTDFIFSAIGEEFGFIGSMVILLSFWFICLRLVLVAQNAKDTFGGLLAIGVLSMIVFQVVVNIGMTIGLAPVTGIPLPWLSYGRSALLTNFIALGLVESVAYHREKTKKKF
ncbi:rod shape-determining protein RodA [Laspinema palackyanum]|uniref:rod shape-determining protein RodA n=1 Tax=Laspinema palackyanum TaxID=3231601 RepID=UPI00345DF4E6|nr:rod shape-determining protein RodA [Laspinema sp. D2c]